MLCTTDVERRETKRFVEFKLMDRINDGGLPSRGKPRRVIKRRKRGAYGVNTMQELRLVREWFLSLSWRMLKPKGTLEETSAFRVAMAMWMLSMHRPGRLDRLTLLRELEAAIKAFQRERRESEHFHPNARTVTGSPVTERPCVPRRPACQRAEPALRVAPFHVEGLDESPAAKPCDEAWIARLAINPRISSTTPVIRGTKIPVSLIVSLVASGCSWAEIRQRYPELVDDDIRASLSQVLDDEPPPIAGRVGEQT
jgi:uncharacterized protein (DUF433 family)